MNRDSSESNRISFGKFMELFITDDVRSVARRMFVTNSIDSLLAYSGAVLGNLFAGNENPVEYLATGIGLALSVSLLSNFLATFFVEEAERRIELREVSKHLLKDISSSLLGKAPRVVALYVAFWSALGALLFPLIASIPFLFSVYGLIDVLVAVVVSIAIVVVTLFALGYYLGSLIGRDKVVWGIKLALIGAILLILSIIREITL
ncbi:MAG: hypothetical protein ABWW65_03820 [Thermoprotei archaeon]